MLLDYSAVEFRVKNGVRVVGIDYLSIESFDTKDNVHKVVLSLARIGTLRCNFAYLRYHSRNPSPQLKIS